MASRCAVCCAHLPSSSSAKRRDRWLPLTPNRDTPHDDSEDSAGTDEDEDEEENEAESDTAEATSTDWTVSRADVDSKWDEQCCSDMEEARDDKDERDCAEKWERGAEEELDEVQRLADKDEKLAVADEQLRTVIDNEEETGVRVQPATMEVTARRLKTLQQRVNGMARGRRVTGGAGHGGESTQR